MAIDDSQVIQNVVGLIVGRAEDISLVACAETGAEALAQLDTMAIDVVTLDLELPDIDGIDLLSLLVTQDKVGIIVLSSRAVAAIETRFPHVVAFDKASLFDDRDRYLAAIRNASVKTAQRDGRAQQG